MIAFRQDKSLVVSWPVPFRRQKGVVSSLDLTVVVSLVPKLSLLFFNCLHTEKFVGYNNQTQNSLLALERKVFLNFTRLVPPFYTRTTVLAT